MSSESDEGSKFLHLVGSRLPEKLRRVSIRVWSSYQRFDGPLLAFLRQQPNLESIEIRGVGLSNNFANALAECRNLRSVVLLDYFADQVTRIGFLDALATSCPALEMIDLHPSLRRREYDPEVKPLHRSVIQPLLNLRQLVEVRLDFWLELLSDPDTVFAMGRAWCGLQTLRLTIPLQLLPSIASAFQATLHTLSLTITFKSDADPLPPADAASQTLPHLEYFEVLYSNLPHGRVSEVGEFLAVCCPQATIVRRLDGVNFGGSFVAGSPWALVIDMVKARRQEAQTSG